MGRDHDRGAGHPRLPARQLQRHGAPAPLPAHDALEPAGQSYTALFDMQASHHVERDKILALRRVLDLTQGRQHLVFGDIRHRRDHLAIRCDHLG